MILDIKFLIFRDFLIFQSLEPRIYGFYCTKMAQTIQEKYGIIFKKYYQWASPNPATVRFGSSVMVFFVNAIVERSESIFS